MPWQIPGAGQTRNQRCRDRSVAKLIYTLASFTLCLSSGGSDQRPRHRAAVHACGTVQKQQNTIALAHAESTPLLHGTAEPAVSSSSSSSRASAALAAHSSVMMNIEQGPGSPAVLSKVYWNTLPLLCLIAALCYIDRTNLAYASFSLTKDLNFSPSVYGTGSGLFFVGYSLAMIPSQLLGLRIGVARWLGILVSVWGLVAASFSTISSVTQFYVLRFLLGVAEAGAFPAIWYYLYLMLPKEALTLPFSALEAAVSTANVLSAPLAAGLLLLESTGGFKGWQWLFVCEGIATLLIGLTTAFVLPAGLAQASYLSSAERRWIQQQQGRGSKPVDDTELFSDWKVLREAFSNWKVWFCSVIGICKAMAANAMLFWLPIMVAKLLNEDGADFGSNSSATPHRQLVSGTDSPSDAASTEPTGHHQPQLSLPVLLSAIPFFCTAVVAVLLGRSSQARGERSLHLAIPYLIAGWLFFLMPLIQSMSPVLALIALCIAISCTVGSNSVCNSYIPVVSPASSVSVSLALFNSVGNLGGILGPWLTGVLVEATGQYDSAMTVLGLVMLLAAAMAWSTRTWEGVNPKSPLKQDPSIVNSRSVGVGVGELQGLLGRNNEND